MIASQLTSARWLILCLLLFTEIVVKADTSDPAEAKEIRDETQGTEDEDKWVSVIGGVRLNGPGLIWGAGAGVRKLYNGSTDILAGATFGKNRGLGLMIRDIPSGLDALRLSLFTVSLQELNLETSYSRGLNEDSPVIQEIHGQGFGLLGDFKYYEDHLTFNTGIIQTTAGFGGYETTGGDVIELPDAFLPDVKTLNLIFAVKWKSVIDPGPETFGWAAGLGFKTDSGRTGQADQLVSTLDSSVWYKFHHLITVRGRIKTSDASVLKRQEKYETREGVLTALKVNCERLSSDAATRCSKLKNELADYIAANNKYGTANPGGGAQGLRGYRELQIKASSLRLLSLEIPFLVSGLFDGGLFRNPKYKLEIVPFVDLGYSSDKQSDLYKKSAISRGSSLRLHLDKLPVRLSYANGAGKPVWFLTVGLPW